MGLVRMIAVHIRVDARLRDLVTAALEHWGRNLIRAASGDQVMGDARRIRRGVVARDLSLPDLGGWEVKLPLVRSRQDSVGGGRWSF